MYHMPHTDYAAAQAKRQGDWYTVAVCSHGRNVLSSGEGSGGIETSAGKSRWEVKMKLHHASQLACARG